MATINLLPDVILRKQICQECYNYLSVPPIVINNQGETICGRCVGSTENEQKTKSLFNVIASGFHFKCINHFNGCTKLLAFEEVQSHEKECFYEPQECMFCSFSGNLSQIFNHTVKIHPENVSLDGVFSLPLYDHSLKKTLLFPIKDNHLLIVRIELTESLLKIVLKLITKELPLNINQYAVKFYKPGDQETSTNYGLFSVKLENTIENNKEELLNKFGLANIHCQILMDTFTLESKELELQKRIVNLRLSEERITNLERRLKLERAEIHRFQILTETLEKKELELQTTILDLQRCEEHASELERSLQKERDELLRQRNICRFAKEVIKKMSCNFFKCSKCQKVTRGETFYCPKNHCYCKSCLSSFCEICKVIRHFTRVPSLVKFTVPCDWPDCNEDICIKNFWSHKAQCKFRPYKCPLQNCSKIILSTEELREHWHAESPTLITGSEVVCERSISKNCKEYYLISINNDIFHLLISFDDNDIQAYVEEYDVLQDAVTFKCEGLYDGGWTNIEMSQFCGRYLINAKSATLYSTKKLCI